MNNWISVKDRLPEEGKEVLTFNGYTIRIDYLREGGNSWGHAYYFDCPTHWIPLPELPKEKP